MTCTEHESVACMGVNILAKSRVVVSLVIMERARPVTPPWLILKRGLYPLPGQPPLTE